MSASVTIASSQLENVATWAGLLTGVAGVVLAIVAIWFSLSTERRSASVSDQTIRSLQKIESQVDRSSKDTQDLIKIAWDRLMGQATTGASSGQGQLRDADSSGLPLDQVIAGLGAELKAQLTADVTAGTGDTISDASAGLVDAQVERMERLVEDLQRTIVGQMESGTLARSPGDAIDGALRVLRRLPPRQYELMRAIVSGPHLDEPQFKALAEDPLLGGATLDLRERGLIVPLNGHGEDGANELVYWLTPGTPRAYRAAFQLIDREDSRKVTELVRSALRAVGYRGFRQNGGLRPEAGRHNDGPASESQDDD